MKLESFAGAEILTSSNNKGNCTYWTQLVFCQTHTSSHGLSQLRFRCVGFRNHVSYHFCYCMA